MSKPLPTGLAGKSLEEFSRFLSEQKDGLKAEDCGRVDVCSLELDKSNRIPENLTYLFGRYPMNDQFSVTTCNYCERIVATTYIEKHVEECVKIPQVIKDELHLLIYGKKLRSTASRRLSSTGDKPVAVSRLAKQSSPSPELRSSQPSKGRSAAASARTCSSAPSSPTAGSSSSQPLDKAPPLLSLNYSFPTIKIEKSACPVPKNAPPSPGVAVFSEALKLQKPVQFPQQETSLVKVKPSVVLKIKGNTSTTTTSAVRVALEHVRGSELSNIQDSTDGDTVSQGTISPKQPPAAVQTPEPQINRNSHIKLDTVRNNVTNLPSKSDAKLQNATNFPSKKKRHDARKVIPLRERRFNPDEHCGVFGSDGTQCKRSLTCKTHSMALRRAVPGRSHPFDSLISTQKQARDKAKLAKQESVSPASPAIVSSVLASNISSDGSSDASRLSVLSQPQPITGVVGNISAVHRLLPIPVTSSTITLQKILNTGIQHVETSYGQVTAIQSSISTSPISVSTPPSCPSFPTPKKKIKKIKDIGDAGMKFQLVATEPDRFEYVTHIIPPDSDTYKTEDCALFEPSPFKNGRNILLMNDISGKLYFEPFPMVGVPVGRKNKEKWRQRSNSSQIFRRPEDYHPISKKLRREDSIEKLLLGNGDWLQSKPFSEAITLIMGKADEDEVGQCVIGAAAEPIAPRKISFRIHPKRRCVPHRVRNGTYLDPTKHVGPLVEVTHALNGVTMVTPSVAQVICNPVEISDHTRVKDVHAQKVSEESYEENGGSWIIEPVPIPMPVDAPVADSELSKLLAAQFEDY